MTKPPSSREAVPDIVWDRDRRQRTGLDEALLCEGKSVDQIASVVQTFLERSANGDPEPLLLTRLTEAQWDRLPADQRAALDFDRQSRTALLGAVHLSAEARVGVVSAGTADMPVAREAVRTLHFYGERVEEIYDVGVAGLWRTLAHLDRLRELKVLIVAAGMDGALPSVIGGLVPAVLIAVPTATGYGVAASGQTALNSILASCAPGVLTVNVDNGYGAACAAVRVLNALGSEGSDS